MLKLSFKYVPGPSTTPSPLSLELLKYYQEEQPPEPVEVAKSKPEHEKLIKKVVEETEVPEGFTGREWEERVNTLQQTLTQAVQNLSGKKITEIKKWLRGLDLDYTKPLEELLREVLSDIGEAALSKKPKTEGSLRLSLMPVPIRESLDYPVSVVDYMKRKLKKKKKKAYFPSNPAEAPEMVYEQGKDNRKMRRTNPFRNDENNSQTKIKEDSYPSEEETVLGSLKLSLKLPVYRYHTEQTQNTDSFRGGTWYFAKSESYDFSNRSDIGGSIKSELEIELQNPLVLEDVSIKDGSFAVINEGFEDAVASPQRKLAEKLYNFYFMQEEDPDDDQLNNFLRKILTQNGNTPDQILQVSGSQNKFDAAMDLIISKGLKASGYDGLILTNVHNGEELDRHIFKFANRNGLKLSFYGQEGQEYQTDRNQHVPNAEQGGGSGGGGDQGNDDEDYKKTDNRPRQRTIRKQLLPDFNKYPTEVD